MNVAIVGGGRRCERLLRFIESQAYVEIQPKVVAVADIDSAAPGYRLARERGIHVATDYNELLARDDIELIVELTGDMAVYHDIMARKHPRTRAIAHPTVHLFGLMSHLSRGQGNNLKIHEARTIYEVVINELIREDVMIIDADYRISDINDPMLIKFGLKREDVIGRFCYEITHHRDTPCSGRHHPCPLTEALRTRRPSKATHVHLDRNKNEIYYAISCFPIVEGDNVVGAIEISRDITRDINSRVALMRQEKLMSIGRLSAGVAHEINNPLTTILTSSMLIQEDIDQDNPIYEELETISREALRCRKIVKSLLDFARQSRPMKKMYDLNEIVAESFQLARKQGEFKDVILSMELGESLPAVFLDKDQIEQCLINLALNAIEATDPGGRMVFATGREAADRLFIKIRDTGAGIPPEHLNNIFEPFFTTREDGTGLGLAITHGIVEQHGGTIRVESKVGEGTCFTITLPVHQEEMNES